VFCMSLALIDPALGQTQSAEACPNPKGWEPKEKLQQILSAHQQWLERWDRRVSLEEWAMAHPEGKASLCNANLSGAELNNRKLSFATLTSVDLSSASLNNADLSWVELNNVDLSRAKLNNASFFKAKLDDVNLNGADLRGATLQLAVLNNMT